MIGQITKILSNAYRVSADGVEFNGIARGRLKREGELFVGDFVEFETLDKLAAINRVLPRKNVLIRPYVANIDTVLIVIAPEPEPELLLADKILLNAHSEGVDCVLAYNKSDLAGDFGAISRAYRNVLPVVSVSAATGEGVGALIGLLRGKTVAFAGQSAVGKTSLLNAFLAAAGKIGAEKVGALSEKSRRGKNTTRRVELYDLGTFRAADTCGFNVLEYALEDERGLPGAYAEYEALKKDCKFRNCAHMEEPGCTVKASVDAGALDAGRYARYRTIYEEIKQKRGEKYD